MKNIKKNHLLVVIFILCFSIFLITIKLNYHSTEVNLVAGKIYDESAASKPVTVKTTSNQATTLKKSKLLLRKMKLPMASH